MAAVCQAVPFGNQPLIELSAGLVAGYAGVDYIDAMPQGHWQFCGTYADVGISSMARCGTTPTRGLKIFNDGSYGVVVVACRAR